MTVPSINRKYQNLLLCYLEVDGDVIARDFVKFVCDQEEDITRIDLVYEKVEKYGILEHAFCEDKKLDDNSDYLAEFENDGNVFFVMGEYEKSMLAWTMMMMLAKSDERLARGYAKRSEVLFKLGLYEECKKDIERALALGYPQHLRSQLFKRRNKASEFMKSKIKIKPYENPPTIPDHQANPVDKHATKSVEIRIEETQKYIIAAKDIQIGEVISVEPPAVSSVSHESYLFHCHHCFKLCYNPIPCDNCTKTIFCDETCKQNALAHYHRDECPILNSFFKLFSTEFSIMLPWRIFFQRQSEEKSRFVEIIKNTPFANTEQNLFNISVIAAVFYGLVKKHTGKFDGPDSEEEEAYFKNLIFKYIPYCVRHFMVAGERVCSQRAIDSGSGMSVQPAIYGVYPLTKTFRHSCCPNVCFYTCGLTVVTVAVKTIKKGQECCISCGIGYGSHTLEQRKQILSTLYGFECKCRACEEDWPQPEMLSDPRFLSFQKQFESELVNYNVDSIKRDIKKTIKNVRRLEATEPSIEFSLESMKLLNYFNALGNKRRVT